MIQNHINKQYKIGSLSPTSIYNPNIVKARKQKRSFMSNMDDVSNYIEEDVQQEKISPKIIKNKSNSCDQIGVTQCKTFQKKIQMKKNQKVQSSFLKSDQMFNLNEGQNLQDNEKKLNFSQQYRLNLRRTVYNQTKLMIKQRKNKLKQKLYSIDPDMKKNQRNGSTNTISTQISQKINIKHLVHKNKFKSDSQQSSSNADTMYKTMIKNRRSQAHAHSIHNGELDISKFPLINRSKNQNTMNYSNLLMTLDMRQNYNKKEKSKAKINRGSSRKSNFEKHEIKPWETYADQFLD